jgi:hypothetical protein
MVINGKKPGAMSQRLFNEITGIQLGPHPSQAASVEVDELAFEVGQVRSRAMRDLGGGGGAIR